MNCLKGKAGWKGRIADCGILWKESRMIAAIELKGGQNIKISQLVSQLQGGLNLLDHLVTGQQVDAFFPILLHRAKRDPTASLADKRVSFRSQKRRIIVRQCGSRLASILENMGYKTG